MKKYLGFTLVELLVVISIMSILVAIGGMTYGQILKNNRDLQRMRDLNSVKQALELYRNDHGYYPASLVLDCTATASFSSGGKTYMEVTPKDPRCNSQKYVYRGTSCVSSTCNAFNLCAKEEGSGTFSNCDSTEDCGSGSGSCDIGITSN